jgi:hypothetical protein
MSGAQIFRNMSVLVIFSCISVLISHYSYINSTTIFSPWHHDDFNILTWPMTPAFNVIRPVTTNLFPVLALTNSFTVYTICFLMSILAFSFLSNFALLFFGANLKSFDQIFMAAISSLTWFNMPGSVYQYQYLGMMPQLTSIIFSSMAIILAHWLINSTREKNPVYLFLFFMLCVLSCLSKEDTIMVVIVYCAFEILKKNDTSIKISKILFFIAIISFALMIAHIKYIGSPVVFGEGAYKVQNVWHGLFFGIKFYFFTQHTVAASFVLVLFFCSWELVKNIRLHPISSITFFHLFNSKIVLVSTIIAVLILPYLILPRKFEFYSIAVQPLLITAAIILVYSHIRISNQAPFARLVLSWLAVFLIIGLNYSDRDQTVGHLNWIKFLRTITATEAAEIEHYRANGLGECKKIIVKGVDDISLFLAEDSDILDEILGVKTEWVILTKIDTRMHVWAYDSGRVFSDNWRYVSRIEDAGVTDCTLEFNASTNRATFTQR